MKKNWMLAGAGAAAAVVLAAALASRPGAVSADQSEDTVSAAESKSFFARFTASGPEMLTLPTGTQVRVRLQHGISTERNSPGDTFTAYLPEPLSVDGKTVAPAGSLATGMLMDVTDSGRVQGRASLTLVLRKLSIDGKEYDFATKPVTLVAADTKKKDAAVIAGSAAAGALVGAIAGGGKGAAIGAGVGGGGGTGYVLATKGEPVAFGPEARFTFSLTDPLALPVYEK